MFSKFNSRLAGRSARAGLLAALALVAVAAFGATGANAAFTAPYNVKCTGSDIAGRGASFQNTAQTTFINWWDTNTQAGSTGGCGPNATQTITYDPAGSGAGRNAFGQGVNPRDPNIRYIGTDEAPNPTQRAEMEAAQDTTGVGKLAIAPIATAALPVIVHFPRHCELAAGDPDLAPYARFQISNARLEAMWVGDANNDEWGEVLPGIKAIPNNTAGRTTQECQDHLIKRIVRFDNSGTTFSFKQFLGGINPGSGWSALANQAWPNPANVLNGGSAGNGPLAAKVKATQGSIGYSDLATARNNDFKKLADNPSPLDPAAYSYNDTNAIAGYGTYAWNYTFNKRLFWIPLEAANAGGPSGSGSFKEPTLNTIGIRNNKRGSNCAGVVYNNVPLNGSGQPDQFGNWAPVNGTLGVGKFPLCTITYAGFWDDYADVYGNTAVEQAKARTVKDFITTSVYSGQNELYKNDFTPLPSNLKLGAQTAIVQMNWNKP